MVKVNINLIQGVSKARQQNMLRYHIAMELLDKKGAGWVDLDDFANTVASKFQIKSKTVLHNLYKMENAGWGKIGKNRFYRTSPKKLIELFDVEGEDHTAVWLGWEHITTIDATRAHFYEAVVSHKTGEKTIARETLTELTGHSRKTQRKYESRVGVKVKQNFATLKPYDGDPATYQNTVYGEMGAANSVFVGEVNGQQHIMRQIPNTYTTNLNLGKKRCGRPVIKSRYQKGNTYNKRYFETNESIRGAGERIYLRLENGLWCALDDC